jgi:hypothetical protein
MNTGFTVDTAEFRKALREYSSLSSRELSEIINSRMFFVALKAFRALAPTFKFEQQAIIRSRLEAAPSKVAARAARSGSASKPLMLANLLVQAARKKKGLLGLQGRKLHTASNKLIRRRAASAGYLKSALASAMRYFSRYTSGQRSPEGRRMRGIRNQQQAAVQGFNPVASFALSIGMKPGQESKVSSRYSAAVQSALDSETEQLKQQIAIRMQRLSDKLKGR